MPHGDADHGVITPSSTFYDQGRFGRLFPTLPPFASDTPLVRAALTELGQPSGLMDADDVLSDPIALITNPALSADNPDNPRLSAGMTFPGQRHVAVRGPAREVHDDQPQGLAPPPPADERSPRLVAVPPAAARELPL